MIECLAVIALEVTLFCEANMPTQRLEDYCKKAMPACVCLKKGDIEDRIAYCEDIII